MHRSRAEPNTQPCPQHTSWAPGLLWVGKGWASSFLKSCRIPPGRAGGVTSVSLQAVSSDYRVGLSPTLSQYLCSYWVSISSTLGRNLSSVGWLSLLHWVCISPALGLQCRHCRWEAVRPSPRSCKLRFVLPRCWFSHQPCCTPKFTLSTFCRQLWLPAPVALSNKHKSSVFLVDMLLWCSSQHQFKPLCADVTALSLVSYCIYVPPKPKQMTIKLK